MWPLAQIFDFKEHTKMTSIFTEIFLQIRIQNEYDCVFTYFSKINSNSLLHSSAIVTMPLANLGQKLKNSLVCRQCSLAIGHRASVNRQTAFGHTHVLPH